MTENLSFRSLEKGDYPYLLKWLMSENVRAWWDKDVIWTLEAIEAKYQTYVEGYKIEDGRKKSIRSYIVCAAGHPIGYLQAYKALDFLRTDFLNFLPKPLDSLDFYLGETSFLGQGLGKKALLQYIKFHEQMSKSSLLVILDKDNQKAIQTCKKVGFSKLENHSIPQELWMVKVYNG